MNHELDFVDDYLSIDNVRLNGRVGVAIKCLEKMVF